MNNPMPSQPEPPTATAVRVMHALGHRCSEVADAFGGYDCTCGEYSWSNAGSYPPGGGCPRGWNDARAAIAALPSDADRLTPQDQPGDEALLDARAKLGNAIAELSALQADLRLKNDIIVEATRQLTAKDESLDDAAAELSRLRADMRIRQGALADVLGVPRHEDPASYYTNIEVVSILRKDLGRARLDLEEARTLRDGWIKQYGEMKKRAVDAEAALAQARDQTGTATLEVDGDTGPWYLRLLHEPVASTTEQPGPVRVDWTADGRMIGVEILPDQTATPSELQVPPSLGVGDRVQSTHDGMVGTVVEVMLGGFRVSWDDKTTTREPAEDITARPVGTGDTAQPGGDVIEQAGQIIWSDQVDHLAPAEIARHLAAAGLLATHPDTQDSEGEVPAWLAEILHVVKGFADREHQGAAPTLVPWHAQNALFAVPADIAEAARINPARQEPGHAGRAHCKTCGMPLCAVGAEDPCAACCACLGHCIGESALATEEER